MELSTTPESSEGIPTALAVIRTGSTTAGALLHTRLKRSRRRSRRGAELGNERCRDTGSTLWKTSLLHGVKPCRKAPLYPVIPDVGVQVIQLDGLDVRIPHIARQEELGMHNRSTGIYAQRCER